MSLCLGLAGRDLIPPNTQLFTSPHHFPAGHWERGKKHGWSVYTVETGQQWAGSWQDGRPAWVLPLTAHVDMSSQAGGGGDEEEEQGEGEGEGMQESERNVKHAVAAARLAHEVGGILMDL